MSSVHQTFYMLKCDNTPHAFNRVLVDKIDRDSDGKITEEELKFYIDHTQKRYIYEDVDRQWTELNPDNKPSILWGEYVNRTYGFDVGKSKNLKVLFILLLNIYYCKHGEENTIYIRFY